MTDQSHDRLRNYPYEVAERAAIYEFEAGMTREDAEDKAIAEYRQATEAAEDTW